MMSGTVAVARKPAAYRRAASPHMTAGTPVHAPAVTSPPPAAPAPAAAHALPSGGLVAVSLAPSEVPSSPFPA